MLPHPAENRSSYVEAKGIFAVHPGEILRFKPRDVDHRNEFVGVR
jgi:hypothetical protein